MFIIATNFCHNDNKVFKIERDVVVIATNFCVHNGDKFLSSSQQQKMTLNEEQISQALVDIESNPIVKEFIIQFFVSPEIKLTRLSNKKVLNLEHLTKTIIEYNQFSNDKFASKRASLSQFVKLHPWIKVDYNKPFDSLYNWLQLYNKAGKLEENQYLIIHQNGEIDITTIE